MASEILSNSGIQIRDNLVNTAVKFLNNPNVQRCTLESKERFLRSKGLTDPEIQKALEKTAEMLDLPSMASDLMMFQARRNLLRDHVVPLLVYGGIAFGCYWLYKNCIRQLLFVEQPKRKTTSECIDELRKSLDVLNANVTSLRGEMQSASQQAAARAQIGDLQADIASVKAILLNRNQFPSLKGRSEAASLPAWQLDAERPRARRSESGGSNSSEGEHATKNSDSSLEIINFGIRKKANIIEKPKLLTAYKLWMESEWESIKAENPGLKHVELCKKVGAIWKSKKDKSEWERKAAEAKEQYEKDVEAYNLRCEEFDDALSPAN